MSSNAPSDICRDSFQPDDAGLSSRDIAGQLRRDKNTSTRKARVLLVTDQDRSICNLIAGALAVAVDEIEVVDNGKDALAAFSKSRFEMVLIDFAMPGMCGWSLPWCIKIDAPQTLIGILTEAQSVEFMQTLLENSYDLIFLQPTDLQQSQKVYM